MRGCRRLIDMDAYRLKPMIPESSATASSNHQVYIITSDQITKTPTPSSSRKSESQWLRLNGTYILRCSPSREFPYIHVCRCTCCAFLARLTYMRHLLGYMYIVYSFLLGRFPRQVEFISPPYLSQVFSICFCSTAAATLAAVSRRTPFWYCD